MAKEISIYPTRGHLLKIDDKYYKLKKERKDEEGRTIIEEIYEEVEPEAYIAKIQRLAEELDGRANISLKAIIADALKDLPLDRVVSIGEQLKRDKERLFARRPAGGCVELKIGNEHLVLRE